MEFANCVHDSFNNPVLAEFIDGNLDSFFENKVTKTCDCEIPEGMKLVKAFKFFESNKTTLRSIQDMASQLIQENKIKGTLCFSVHPLDFLSSSENTYNWRSCHALDGEYRAGNLSYMVDDVTFMVYLKGADNTYIPMFPENVKWNSKKWRMLIHSAVDDEIMFAGRQYPFNSRSGIDIVLNIYNNLMIEEYDGKNPFGYSNKFGGWKSDYIDGYVPHDAPADSRPVELSGKYFVFDNRLVDLSLVVKEGCNALNYNDVLRSTCYLYPYYTILNPWGWHSVEHLTMHPIEIGGEIACLHCGQEIIENSETMRCNDCEMEYGYEENDTYSSCACCGARIYIDDAPSVGDNEDLVCDNCYRSECFVCDNCGDVYYKSDMMYIEKNGEEYWCCPHCYEDIRDSKETY